MLKIKKIGQSATKILNKICIFVRIKLRDYSLLWGSTFYNDKVIWKW